MRDCSPKGVGRISDSVIRFTEARVQDVDAGGCHLEQPLVFAHRSSVYGRPQFETILSLRIPDRFRAKLATLMNVDMIIVPDFAIS